MSLFLRKVFPIFCFKITNSKEEFRFCDEPSEAENIFALWYEYLLKDGCHRVDELQVRDIGSSRLKMVINQFSYLYLSYLVFI